MKRDELYGVLKKHFFIKDLEKAPISKIGEGAWHDVYKMERTGEEDLVLRIKKKTRKRVSNLNDLTTLFY
jgi:hypothetical protein